MNWDDLRVVAAVHRSGSYAGAARDLGMDETTVARRLGRLGKTLGGPLFDAVDGQRRATPLGRAVLDEVAEMEQRTARIHQAAEALDRGLSGPVGRIRLAGTPTVVEEMLAPSLSGFLERHPGLTLELLTATETVDFHAWKADMALRLRRPEQGNFVMARVGKLTMYLVEPAALPDGAVPLVAAYPDVLAFTPESQALAARVAARWGGKAPRCLTTSPRVIAALLRDGRAVGALPAGLAAPFARDSSRWRVTPVAEARELWLLTQPHLRDDPAARAVSDWLRQVLAGP